MEWLATHTAGQLVTELTSSSPLSQVLPSRVSASTTEFGPSTPPLPADASGVVGCFAREDHAHFDETQLAAQLLAETPSDAVMVDIGAHHGSSLAPFLKRGWKVFAFEPDPKNRAQLEKRFGAHPLLTIDARAVSDSSIGYVPFYASEESTGISSLSAFTEGHRQACLVSTTTLAEIVAEQNLSQIDFLKIDTEGYDLMALKGVPWDRIQPKLIVCEFEDRKTCR